MLHGCNVRRPIGAGLGQHRAGFDRHAREGGGPRLVCPESHELQRNLGLRDGVLCAKAVGLGSSLE